MRCKQPSENSLCPECLRTPLENIETPHAMPQPAAGVTIEPCTDRPCWIVRDASGAESLLTADRTSAELRAERLRIMGGRWKTAEQLCDMIMEHRRREAPTPTLATLNARLTEISGADLLAAMEAAKSTMTALFGSMQKDPLNNDNYCLVCDAVEALRAALTKAEGSGK